MKKIAALVLLAAAGAASAAPGGKIDSLSPGNYTCELPGDASGPTGFPQPDESFSIVNGSTYRNAVGRGTYLLTGDVLVMTAGPKRGQSFHRISDNFLRKRDAAGADTALRCVKRRSDVEG